MQLRVIWNLVLQPDPEGPTLISHAAWRSRTLLKSSFHTFVAHSHRHNAPSGPWPTSRGRRSGGTTSRTNAGKGSPATGKSLPLAASPARGEFGSFPLDRRSPRRGLAAIGGSASGQPGRPVVAPDTSSTAREGSCRSTIAGRRRTLPPSPDRGAPGSRRSPDGRSCPDGTRRNCPGSPPRRSAR